MSRCLAVLPTLNCCVLSINDDDDDDDYDDFKWHRRYFHFRFLSAKWQQRVNIKVLISLVTWCHSIESFLFQVALGTELPACCPLCGLNVGKLQPVYINECSVDCYAVRRRAGRALPTNHSSTDVLTIRDIANAAESLYPTRSAYDKAAVGDKWNTRERKKHGEKLASEMWKNNAIISHYNIDQSIR